MATKLDILQIGYSDLVENNRMKASGSCCLVRSNNDKILFDTMGPWERNLLIDSLAKHKIHPDDIEYLVCSHSHPDHIGNNNLFTKAKVHIVGTSVYEHDYYDLSCFEPIGNYSYETIKNEQVDVISYKDYKLNSHISVLPTPGHTFECVSMLLDNCDLYGSIALAGDLYEKEEDLSNESVWLSAGSQNSNLQRAHRSSIYNDNDYIVPGHGPLFKTNKCLKPIRF